MDTIKSTGQGIPENTRKTIDSRSDEFLTILKEKIGQENPIVMKEATLAVSSRACGHTGTGGGSTCSTYEFDELTFPAYMTSDKGVVCSTLAGQGYHSRLSSPSCFLRIFQPENFTENQIIRQFPKGTRFAFLEEASCTEKISGELSDHRNITLYSPLHIFSHVNRYSGLSDDYRFNATFSNVKFSKQVRDAGLLCELTNVSDLPLKGATEVYDPRSKYEDFINLITCKLDHLEEVPRNISRIATYEVQGCNHPGIEF